MQEFAAEISGSERSLARPNGDRPRLIAILPRGEAIRNFVYSGTLDEVSRHADVTVLSVIPSEELRTFLGGCSYSVRALAEQQEPWLVGALRDILDMAHGRYLWSKAAQHRWALRDYEAQTLPMKCKRSTKKLVSYPFRGASGVEFLSRVERLASRLLSTTDEFVRLFEGLRPALVFNSSQAHSQIAMEAVQAAKVLAIPTVAFIFSWDNLTSQGRILLPYDYYFVWNEQLAGQLRQIYPAIRPNQILVTGTPQFDFHFRQEFRWSREQFCSYVAADPRRPIVLYTTGMANHMPGEERIVERVADMLREMTEFGPPQLMVRVYPKDRTARFDHLKRRRKDILFPPVPWDTRFYTPKYEDLYLLTNMLRHCSVGLNIASTITLELCMLDRPVINIGYDPPGVSMGPISFRKYYQFDHYAPVVASGAVEVAYSEEELRQLVWNALRMPSRLSDKRRALTETMFAGTLDGHSASRIAIAILQLATLSIHHGACTASTD